MDSSECTLGLGLILGVLIGALLVGGSAQYKAAMSKVKSVRTERKKYEEALTKARVKRSEGYSDLMAAVLLFLVGIAVLFLAARLLSNGPIF